MLEMIEVQCKCGEDEICVNSDCPCCTEFCPVQQYDYIKICKYSILDNDDIVNKERNNYYE